MTLVYVTEKGDCWHRRRDCHGLVGGQLSSETQGNDTRPVDEVELTADIAAAYDPCGTCGGTTL